MENVTDRELLQQLASAPIGAKHLQDEADAKAHNGNKPSAELKETCQRASKIWLPQGRKSPRRGECNIEAEQTDIEDAIEAAGGQRGGKVGEAAQDPRSPLITVAKHNREFATLYRGEFAHEEPGHYSIFKRKRDAEAFADFLTRLFGRARLEAMIAEPSARPTNDERNAMRAELNRLHGKIAS